MESIFKTKELYRDFKSGVLLHHEPMLILKVSKGLKLAYTVFFTATIRRGLHLAHQ